MENELAERNADLTTQHSEVYEQLADQYEARADDLQAVTAASVERFLDVGNVPRGRALDVGCGVGVTTRCLADAGFEVTAVDISAQMVAHTVRRTPQATGLVVDYLERDLGQFEAIVAFAFIHLFPAALAHRYLSKMAADLAPGGRLLIGTTREAQSSEGFEDKHDYAGTAARYRKRWTEEEFTAAFAPAGLEVLDVEHHTDPFGKCWMDFIAGRTS